MSRVSDVREPLLELRGVSQSFGGLKVIADLDLHVDPGEIAFTRLLADPAGSAS